MKKYVYLILVFSLTMSIAKAQTGFFLGVRLMPQGTGLINHNDFDAGKELDFKTTFGFAGGLAAGYNFTSRVGVELNILYSAQGEDYHGNLKSYDPTKDSTSYAYVVAFQDYLNRVGSDTSYTAKVALHYIKIPLLFHVNSDPTKSTFFYAGTGPEFSFLAGAKHLKDDAEISYVHTDSFPYASTDFTTKEMYRSVVISWVLNVGIGFKIADNLQLIAQLNLDYALGDAEDKDFSTTLDISGFSETYRPWAINRAKTINASAGLNIGLNYRFGGE